MSTPKFENIVATRNLKMSNSTDLSAKNSEIKFFYEDVVYRLGKKGNLQLGMVVENSEFASSDEETSDDDEETSVKATGRETVN